MNIRHTLLLLLIVSTSTLFSANNQLKNRKKIIEKTVAPIKPSTCYTVLACMSTVNPKKETGVEQLAENFWSSSQKFFSVTSKTEWKQKQLKTIDKTLALARIFCTQATSEDPNWTDLHESLEDLSPQEKLGLLNFTSYLGAPEKLLTIIAHSIKNNIIKKPSYYKELQKLETCPFCLTTTTWKKIGVYAGTKTPELNNLFTNSNLLQIPLKDGMLKINPSNGKQSTILEKEKKTKKTTKKTVELARLNLKKGNYSIVVVKDAGEINNQPFFCPKPQEQICLTDRFFSFIEVLEGYNSDSMHARLVNFEQNRDESLNVRRSCDSSMFGSDLYYDNTKICTTNNVIFAKGRTKIDAVDLTSGAHTTFRSDFNIKDIYISPDKKYVAICEDLENQQYSYHLFELVPEKLPLKTYLKPSPLPTTDLYGTGWTLFDTAKSTFTMAGLLLGYK